MQVEEVYRPPQADLEVYAPVRAQPETLSPFFQTAPWKMIVFSGITLGFYPLYWFHKQWSRRRSHGEPVSPLARSIFGVFFAYSLFENVNHQVRKTAPAALPLSMGAPIQPLSSGLLALWFFFFSMLWRLPGALGLAGALATLPLMVAQRRINEIHAAQGYDPDEGVRLSYGDIAVLVIGGLVWIVILVAAFTPAQG